MKVRTGFLLSSATGALLIGVSAISGAMAADTLPVKALPIADSAWNWEGYAELGARFFTRDQGGATGLNWKNATSPYNSLGKFYEYRDLRPGPFGNLGVQGLTKNGLYGFDLWAKNIGYRDQSYSVDLSKAGEHYLGLSWDQTPHTYNNRATTIYNGVGTNNLTISNSLRGTLRGLLDIAPLGDAPLLPSAGNAGLIANTINSNLNEFNLGFRRDTASVDYRWTPSNSWDVKADYTRTRREGTQSQGAMAYQMSSGAPTSGGERSGRVILELPKPVADTTHNANLNTEYAGTSPWGKKFNVALGYGLSLFKNDNDRYSFQNPWVTDAVGDQTLGALTNTMSLAPDNSANTLRLTAGADLPWNSRYNGAVNYTMSRQNQSFIPFTSNSAIIAAGGANVPGGAFETPSISASSLNGGNDTLLINNILTTRLTSNLKSTLRYRYYDFATTQSPITVAHWIYADANAAEDVLTQQGMSYNKQNASADLAWTPKRYLTLGTGAGWERWDRDRRDVNVTNEYSGKVFADLKSSAWSRMRASYVHGERRFDSYVSEVGSNREFLNYRLFDMANRTRDKGNFSIDFFNASGVTITPNFGFRFDDYGTNPYASVLANENATSAPLGPRYAGELGLLKDRAFNVGLDASWKINRDVTLMASYTHEEAQKKIMAACGSHSANACAAGGTFPEKGLDVQATDRTDTFVVGGNAVLVPDKLDVKATYTYVKTFGQLDRRPGAGMTSAVSATTIFPDVDSRFNRLDLQARYRFQPVAMAGSVKTQPYLKLRYLWESNTVNDWGPLNWNYMYQLGAATNTGATYAKGINLGWNNPNYNIQMVMLSYGLTW